MSTIGALLLLVSMLAFLAVVVLVPLMERVAWHKISRVIFGGTPTAASARNQGRCPHGLASAQPASGGVPPDAGFIGRTVTCSACKGDARGYCPVCKGLGWMPLAVLARDEATRCATCFGIGSIVVDFEEPRSSPRRRETCRTCNGIGWLP